MEGYKANNNGPAGSRWNPTKEQISMLETFYMQGLRTPSAEQIQLITNRLRAFGHIEGKNVFYWFQNHKARQRQKQRQDSMASFNRFLHKNSAFPPYFNVVCSPCYVQRTAPPHADMGLYQQYTKMPPHGGFRRILIPESKDKNKRSACQKYNKIMNPTHRSINQECTQRTLDLFPIHPTGILQGKIGVSTNERDSNSSRSYENDCLSGKEGRNCGQNFFDFFCGNGSSKS